jgi:hypothetical protein
MVVTKNVKAAWAVEREMREVLLAALPGKEHHERFDGLNLTSRLFSTNGIELEKHLKKFVGTGRNVKDLPEDYNFEAVRLFHNYLVSVGTFRDAQRTAHRQVWPDRLPKDQRSNDQDSRTVWEVKNYTPKTVELFGDDDIKFLFDLRNFTVHYGLPVMTLATTLNHRPPAPPMWSNSVQLKRAELDKYENWTAPAKRFLKTQEKDVEFLPLLEKYTKRAGEFYLWFWQQIKQTVQMQVDEFHSKSTEVGLWMAEDSAMPDWEQGPDGSIPIPGSLQRKRRIAHAARCAYGTTGWGGFTVDPNGVAVVGQSDWPPLPKVGKYNR